MALSGGSRQLQLLGDKLQPEPFLMTKNDVSCASHGFPAALQPLSVSHNNYYCNRQQTNFSPH